MSIEQSVTQWIDLLKAGDEHAAQHLWERYFAQMVDLAQRKLHGTARVASDEEDVALSAFKSFCLGARDGRFTQLTDRTNLWPLLMAITANKSVDMVRRQNRQKRGGTGKAPTGDANEPQRAKHLALEPAVLNDLISKEPSPEFAAEMAEQFDHLLQKLNETDDADLTRIAMMKMQGQDNKQIAEQLGCVRRTVERKLQLIARLWASEAEN